MVHLVNEILVIMNGFPKFLNLVSRTNWNRRANGDPQRFQMIRISNSPIFSSLENPWGLFISSRGIFKKMGFLRLQQLMQASLNHFQAYSKGPKPKRSKCLTLGFKYHLSIIALSTFQAFCTYPSSGCPRHYSKHDPQCLKIGPNFNHDIEAVLFMIFSYLGWYSIYPVQFKMSTRRRRNLFSWEPE